MTPLLACMLFCGTALSQGTQRTWNGLVNSYWSEPGNWSPFGAPQDGDSLVFGLSPARFDSQNDITNRRISFIELSGGGYNLTGNSIRLDSDITDSHSSATTNKINFNTYFTGGGGNFNLTGAQQGSLLEIRGQVNVANKNAFTIYVNAFNGGGQPGYLT